MIKERLPNYTQVCVFPGLLVDQDKIQEFTDQIKEVFDTRVQYLETILTKPDVDNPENTGGRSDVFLAVHQDDIEKFAVRRLQYGIRWIEDAMSNANGYHLNPIYPEYVEGYKSWNADSNSAESEEDGENNEDYVDPHNAEYEDPYEDDEDAYNDYDDNEDDN